MGERRSSDLLFLQLSSSITLCLLFGLRPVRGHPIITTQGNEIVDGDGNVVTLHGIGWFGFESGLQAPGNLSQGFDSVSKSFDTVVWRIKQLGFNAVRLPFSFAQLQVEGGAVTDYTAPCGLPNTDVVIASVTPPSLPNLPLSSNELPASDPPVVWAPPVIAPKGLCNSDLPNDAVLSRFLWTVKYLVDQGLYVNVDFHSYGLGPVGQSAAALGPSGADFSPFTPDAFAQRWAQLVTFIFQYVPEARGMLLLDLLNEPDGFGLRWEEYQNNSQAFPSLATLYIELIDMLEPICAGSCLYIIEGAGQVEYKKVTWGNGFLTNRTLISQSSGSSVISDANLFFNATLTKPWISQVVLGPHLYCQGVTGIVPNFGTTAYQVYSDTFGYLTTSPGYCLGATCKVFPAILDEFGSTFADDEEQACFHDIVLYANNAGNANDGRHAPIKSFFYWAWNPDSAGTGGLVDKVNWRDVQWNKITALTGGGSPPFELGMGLKPWYLQGFVEPKRSESQTPMPAYAGDGLDLDFGIWPPPVFDRFRPNLTGLFMIAFSSTASQAGSTPLSNGTLVVVLVLAPLGAVCLCTAGTLLAAKLGFLGPPEARPAVPDAGAPQLGLACSPRRKPRTPLHKDHARPTRQRSLTNMTVALLDAAAAKSS